MKKYFDREPKKEKEKNNTYEPYSRVSEPLLERDSFTEFLSAIGNDRIANFFEGINAQAKLKVNQPGDKYEQEADKIAHNIVNSPNNDLENAEKIKVQKKMSTPESAIHIPPEVEKMVQEMKSKGVPLDNKTRSFFQPRFGVDLGNVRIHKENNQERMARALRANAFTIGNDIVFAEGKYQPETNEGQELIAHELVHVEQQEGIFQNDIIQRNDTGRINDEFDNDELTYYLILNNSIMKTHDILEGRIGFLFESCRARPEIFMLKDPNDYTPDEKEYANLLKQLEDLENYRKTTIPQKIQDLIIRSYQREILNFIPFVGGILSIIDAITGKEVLTNYNLGTGQRVFRGVAGAVDVALTAFVAFKGVSAGVKTLESAESEIEQAASKMTTTMTESNLESIEKTELLNELKSSGAKVTESAVIKIAKDNSRKIIYLETGNSKAGLQHIILRHGDEFINAGIKLEEIPDLIMDTVIKGKQIGMQGTRPIYEVVFNGTKRQVAVTISDNGFVVGANIIK
jgi:Domain of unknown function (DUF4157)/Pre-toxin TG